jgi:deoxyribodipyrimidine photo-lyase
MQPVLLWFRRNLRLSDNAALIAAAESGCPVIPVYVADEQDQGTASRWWLHHSLASLDKDLRKLGSSLVIRSGSPQQVLPEIFRQTGATALFYSRRYEPVSRRQEVEVAAELGEVAIHAFDDSLLHDPESVMTRSETPYRVFTPFWRAASDMGDPPDPRPVPASIDFSRHSTKSLQLSELGLLPSSPNRVDGLGAAWVPGEPAALSRIDEYDSTLRHYDQHRDRPDMDATSRLSPHLHFGEVSARQVWHAVRQLELQLQSASASASFLRQLYWRDFSTYLLFHFPTLPDEPLRAEFEHFPWSKNESLLQAWQEGETGYAIVDAGMRQLRKTGWMHNRVRMIAASFLVKDLLIPWQTGAAWFLDNLVDADLANNSASWQWIAGCGSDAAPYFRVFNPDLQRKKFDPHGHYVRRWVPELANTSTSECRVQVIDHGMARQRALEAYQTIKGMRTSKLAP